MKEATHCQNFACTKIAATRGFCPLHYKRFLRHGDPTAKLRGKSRVGQRFGRWEIVQDIPIGVRKNRRQPEVRCRCSCGQEKVVILASLVAGLSESCGCLRTEQLIERSTGSKNLNWKGVSVGYSALHEWVKKRLPKTQRCGHCLRSPPRDLANISQQYKRDLSDWEWLCRKCHVVQDNRLPILQAFANKKGELSRTAKLTEEQARQIIERKRAGEITRSIAKDFGISHQHVSSISTGKKWGHLHLPLPV